MSLEGQAEVLKLARVLGTDPAALGYLEKVGTDDLRRFREQVTGVLFDANLVVLQRMAAASKLLPAPVLAKIAERTFGPMLCARIAGLVDVSRGVDVAKRLSPRFLADVAAELDPRRASGIIVRIPRPTVLAVARELVGREDWITIGRFVGHLPDETVTGCLAEIHDIALLQVAFVLDNKERLEHVLGLLPSDRLAGVLRAAGEHDLWPAALDLLVHVGDARRAQLAAGLDPALRDRARTEAETLGLRHLLG
ncbi:hypothetical protein [Amycolatopsis nigrescens]|uniref:hypothetical protein n=1 Tax=Amycolatopsis nigrescens TaxID=381445 RepID=UPI000362DE2D|nr:hypothetical protein [Amycolatopsis nigrescens]